MRRIRFRYIGALMLGVVGACWAPAGRDDANPPAADTPPKMDHAGVHRFLPGEQTTERHPPAPPHGGLLITVGRQRLELTFDERNGLLTLYVLGEHALAAHPIPADPLAILIEPVDGDGFPFEVKLLPLPQDDDGLGFTSRFVGSAGELHGLQRFEVTLQAPLAGQVQPVTFMVDHSTLGQVYICPMGCEGGTAYEHDGRCPVCNMRLRSPRDAHGDHATKHGGTLFMAADGWHHLEGVLPSRHEFRLYLYNNFTLPIPATRLVDGSFAEIVALDQQRPAAGPAVKLAFSAAAGGEYLRLPIPAGVSTPFEIEVQLRFEGRDEPDVFNFSFAKDPH